MVVAVVVPGAVAAAAAAAQSHLTSNCVDGLDCLHSSEGQRFAGQTRISISNISCEA